MAKCFVIQPFDGGKFDKLYADVFKPAIEDAGLEAYRVDGDPRASELFEKILEGIERSDLCLAEVSTDNPNVWFELGYAFAFHRAEVAIVADRARVEKPPFDIKNLRIVAYDDDSSSDFAKLRSSTTERIRAVLENKKSQGPDSRRFFDLGSLHDYEIAALRVVAQHVNEPDEGITAVQYQEKMARLGFSREDATLALGTLRQMEMLERFEYEDWNGDVYWLHRLTSKSTRWLRSNRPKSTPHDDIPF